jgi:hypothetical protein
MLAQLAAEHIHGVVAAVGAFGEVEVRQQEGAGFPHACGCGARIGRCGFAQRIFLKGDGDGLLQR